MIRFVRIRTALAIVFLVLAPLGVQTSAHASSDSLVCTWGGTAVAPTGTFTITPGLTNTPSTGPAVFEVTGKLGGDCRGTLTYDGQIDAGSTCELSTFQGAADGIRGVARFEGVGVGPLGPARLYDAAGNVVGSENANVGTAHNGPHLTDCTTAPGGFTGGTFHSLIVLTGGGR